MRGRANSAVTPLDFAVASGRELTNVVRSDRKVNEMFMDVARRKILQNDDK
jgi:hypothetical protein